MAENRRKIQLHKKGDQNDQWIPLTVGSCVQLTDYKNDGVSTGPIHNAVDDVNNGFDDLNTALMKLENTKADAGDTLADYNISDAYTKDEVDSLLSRIYRVQGSIDPTDVHDTLSEPTSVVGDVYDLLDDMVMTSDFIEYESGVTKTIEKGTNIVIVEDANENLKWDVLAMSISGQNTTYTISFSSGVLTLTPSVGEPQNVNIPDTDTTYSLSISDRTISLTPSSGTADTVTVPEELPSVTGNSGKYLKVVDNSGTLTVSWEAIPAGVSYTAGAGLELSLQNEFSAKLKSTTNATYDSENISNTQGRQYAVVPDKTNGYLSVNVPWTGLPALTTEGKSLKIINDNSTLKASWEDDSDRYVNSASFADDTTNNSSSPVKMTLTRAGSDSATVTANIPKVSSSSAGVVPKGASVSSQSQSTKFLREDGTWAAPSYGSAYQLPAATSAALGGVQIGYQTDTTNKNYAVQLDNSDNAYVNVPWTDTTYSSETAAQGGTTVSLVTTGEKYNWNNKLDSHQTIKQDGITGATVNRFGTCSTAASTATKEVTITGTLSLEAGARVTVKFSNKNTANSPKLKVGSTTAKDIYIRGVQITTANQGLLSGICDFIYDGTYWNLISNAQIDEQITVSSGSFLTSNTLPIESGRNYTFSGDISSLTITTINATGDLETNITFKLTSNATGTLVTLPSGAKFVKEEPTWEAGGEYIISYYKNLFVFGEIGTKS